MSSVIRYPSSVIRLGTRKSPLAIVQAEQVAALLRKARPGAQVELMPMTTTGDQLQSGLTDAGGKGLFTKEIEEALLDNRVDIGVHSMKDMATILPDGLIITCMLEREDPRDMLVGAGLASLDDIPRGATFGTSSLRRAAQLLMQRPDIRVAALRGNVQTRLGKIESGDMRATMLARAGLNRLKLFDVPGVTLDTQAFLPAIAQGAIGIECREGDTDIQEMLSPLADIDTETAVLCERAFLRILDGSCRTPIAGYATIDAGILQFSGLIVRPDGSRHHRIDISGDAKNAETLGITAGEALLEKAGKDFLK